VSDQSELVDRILGALSSEGLIEKFIVVGSWCMYFYKHRFGPALSLLPWRTRDIEFNISNLRRASRPVDVTALFQHLDFVISFSGKGFVVFEHPQLIVEFLVPEKGRGTDGPCEFRGFNINAQPLRFLSLLEDEVITIDYNGFPVRTPHPACFALHKLIISSKRTMPDKAQKDREQACAVWDMLVTLGESEKLSSVYSSMPRPWQKIVNKVLENIDGQARLKNLAAPPHK
jgi:hypothetical protein